MRSDHLLVETTEQRPSPEGHASLAECECREGSPRSLAYLDEEGEAARLRSLPLPRDLCRPQGAPRAWTDPARPGSDGSFSLARFEDHVHATLTALGVAGYALAYQTASTCGTRTHGYLRAHDAPPVVPQSTTRRQYLGALENTVAAVATLKAMGTAWPGISPEDAMEAPVGRYLPDDLEPSGAGRRGLVSLRPGSGVRDLTFRQFLSQATGLRRGSEERWDTYRRFKADLEDWAPGEWSADDAAYALLPFIVYHLLGNPKPYGPLDVDAYRRYHLDASRYFRGLVERFVLEPSGVHRPAWRPEGRLSTVPLFYATGAARVAGLAWPASAESSMMLSAEEYLRFVRALATGELLPPAWAEAMVQPASERSHRAGIHVTIGDGGRYCYHSGSLSIRADGAPARGAQSGFMIFPQRDLQAVVLVNSYTEGAGPYLPDLLVEAYDAGLIEG